MDIQPQRLTHLRNKGFRPNFILDIGACVGEWAQMVKPIFPQADFLLLEANQDNEPKLMQSGFSYKIALLGDKEKEVEFFKIKNGYNTGNSIFIEQTRHYTGNNFESVKLPMTTLDKLLETYYHSQPEFIKLDVQGAELLILDGAKKTLENCEFILLETQTLEYNKGAPKIHDVFVYMNKIGFEAYDFLANHHLSETGDLMQVDILFAKSNSQFIKKGILV